MSKNVKKQNLFFLMAVVLSILSSCEATYEDKEISYIDIKISEHSPRLLVGIFLDAVCTEDRVTCAKKAYFLKKSVKNNSGSTNGVIGLPDTSCRETSRFNRSIIIQENDIVRIEFEKPINKNQRLEFFYLEGRSCGNQVTIDVSYYEDNSKKHLCTIGHRAICSFQTR